MKQGQQGKRRLTRAGRTAWIVAFLAVLAVRLGAETIIRKDGRKIEGQIVKETEQFLEVQTLAGTFRIPRDQIVSVSGRRAISQNEREGREALALGVLDKAMAKFQAALGDAGKPEDRKEIESLMAKVNEAILQREEQRFSSQLDTARRLIQENRFADAKAELESLLRRNPEPSPTAQMIRRQMGRLYMAEAEYYKDQINYIEAGDAYQRAIELLPDDPAPYFEMATLVQARGGKPTEIIEFYNKGLRVAQEVKKMPQSELLQPYYELGKAYLRAGSGKEPNKELLMEGIKRMLVVARDGATSYPFASIQLENAFAELSKTEYDLEEMIKTLLATLQINPKAQKVRWFLAEVYNKKGEYQKAIDELRVIEKSCKESGEPLPAELHYRLGLAYLALPKPDYDAALQAFENEILQNRLNYMALIRAAELHSANGTYDDAFAYCNRAISLRKERPEAYLVAGDAYVRRSSPGDLQRAKAYLNTALNLNAEFHRARVKLAEIEITEQTHSESPDFAEAEASLHKVILSITAPLVDKSQPQLSEDDKKSMAEIYYWLAQIELHRKNPRAALRITTQALEFNPRFPKALLLQGTLQEQIEAYQEAKQSYLKAIELDPRIPDPYYQLGLLCQNRLRQFEPAIQYYQEYLKRGGTESERVTRWIRECERSMQSAPLISGETRVAEAASTATTPVEKPSAGTLTPARP